MKVYNKEAQDNLTPQLAYKILEQGNKRFVQNVKIQRNLQDQVAKTSNGQYPFAVILSCIDSRVPPELVFDQGIGDIFSARVAGNIINEDILGSIEYACKVAGSKIVLVMGHTKCGAVTAACQNVELGNITSLLSKIRPAVDSIKEKNKELKDSELVEKVAIENVKLTIERIRNDSQILFEMEQKGEIKIVASIYDVSNGEVTFKLS